MREIDKPTFKYDRKVMEVFEDKILTKYYNCFEDFKASYMDFFTNIINTSND
jgi:hypothetical protein